MKIALQYLFVFVLVGIATQCGLAQESQLNLVQVRTGFTNHSVEVPYVEQVSQKYSVEVPHIENVAQTYTVTVPYTENVKQTYTVQVPYTETVTGDDGEEKEVERTRTETKTRMVPVTRTRMETRTRQVPVTKIRTETRTRMVTVNRTRTETRTVEFPPAGATFNYVSGEEISLADMKTKARKEITILKLPAGETLSDFHRTVLKPEVIVMTTPEAESDPPEEELAEEAEEEDQAEEEQAEERRRTKRKRKQNKKRSLTNWHSNYSCRLCSSGRELCISQLRFRIQKTCRKFTKSWSLTPRTGEPVSSKYPTLRMSNRRTRSRCLILKPLPMTTARKRKLKGRELKQGHEWLLCSEHEWSPEPERFP